MFRSGRRTRPGHQVLEEKVWARTLTSTTPVVTSQWLTTHLLRREDSSLKKNFNRSWELEAVEQSSMTAEQHTCEQQFSTHTTQESEVRFVVRYPTRWILGILDILAYLQNKDCVALNVGWKEIQTSNFNTTTSWRIWRTRSHETCEIPIRETNMLFTTTFSSLQRNKNNSCCI